MRPQSTGHYRFFGKKGKDGSKSVAVWHVPGTKRKADNAPTETANYWGTAWAVVGLLER
ncbi:MAG: hypothetical protein KAT50_01630 [Pirellulales bacterium]|nr:hypothetical protein [Pirellulales bacterium]